MSKVTAEQASAWEDIVTRKYADQAIWFLNGFWEEVKGDAENFWMYAELFAELDEFWSHKFLERIGKTMTVIKMREEFRTIDVDFNKKMSMTEFLGYTYHKTIQQIIDAPQGNNQELIDAAQAQVDAAQAAVDEMVAKLQVATQKADEAKAASDAAEAAAAPYRKAVAENEAALAELQAQEKAFADKKAALEKTKNDMSIGVVKRNKAANELDQLLAEDPLPLQRAKINQGATVRKMEKAAKAAEEAKVKADQQAAAAEKAKAEAEAAVAEAEGKLQKAMDALAEAKRSGGDACGSIWWMERQIEEKKKYMPGYKGPRK